MRSLHLQSIKIRLQRDWWGKMVTLGGLGGESHRGGKRINLAHGGDEGEDEANDHCNTGSDAAVTEAVLKRGNRWVIEWGGGEWEE